MFNLNTTAITTEKRFNRIGFIVGALIVLIAAFALLTGDLNGFDRCYLNK